MFAGSIPACVPKLPANLKCNWRFPSARRHREQNAALAGDDRFNRAIDRGFLIVAFALPEREVDRREKLFDRSVVLQLLSVAISPPKFLW